MKAKTKQISANARRATVMRLRHRRLKARSPNAMAQQNKPSAVTSQTALIECAARQTDATSRKALCGEPGQAKEKGGLNGNPSDNRSLRTGADSRCGRCRF